MPAAKTTVNEHQGRRMNKLLRRRENQAGEWQAVQFDILADASASGK